MALRAAVVDTSCLSEHGTAMDVAPAVFGHGGLVWDKLLENAQQLVDKHRATEAELADSKAGVALEGDAISAVPWNFVREALVECYASSVGSDRALSDADLAYVHRTGCFATSIKKDVFTSMFGFFVMFMEVSLGGASFCSSV